MDQNTPEQPQPNSQANPLNSMSISGYLKLSAAILETVLAIPVLETFIVIGSVWSVLFIALALNIVTLVYANKEQKSTVAPIIGIVAAVLGFVPIIGWISHIVAATFYWIDYTNSQNKA